MYTFLWGKWKTWHFTCHGFWTSNYMWHLFGKYIYKQCILANRKVLKKLFQRFLVKSRLLLWYRLFSLFYFQGVEPICKLNLHINSYENLFKWLFDWTNDKVTSWLKLSAQKKLRFFSLTHSSWEIVPQILVSVAEGRG